MEFVTIKQHRYRGKLQKPGDKYEISGKSDARLVQAMGWSIPAPVIVAPVVAPAVAAKVRARVAPIALPEPIVAESTIEHSAEESIEPAVDGGELPAVESQSDKPKRAYKRRDLSAE